MPRRASVVAALVVVAASAFADDAAPPAPKPDAIDQAFAMQHLARKNVGWTSRGTWEGYPRDVPYGDDSDNVKARNFGIGLYTGLPLDVDRPQGGKR
jgi:hypothetical protein